MGVCEGFGAGAIVSRSHASGIANTMAFNVRMVGSTWLRSPWFDGGLSCPSFITSLIVAFFPRARISFFSFVVVARRPCCRPRGLNGCDGEFVACRARSRQQQHTCAEESCGGRHPCRGNRTTAATRSERRNPVSGLCVVVERSSFTTIKLNVENHDQRSPAVTRDSARGN